MSLDRVIFKEKSWVLREIPYNYVLLHNGMETYWTQLDNAVRYVVDNSDLSLERVRELVRGCSQRPFRTASTSRKQGPHAR
jgi:hypothetical protein